MEHRSYCNCNRSNHSRGQFLIIVSALPCSHTKDIYRFQINDNSASLRHQHSLLRTVLQEGTRGEHGILDYAIQRWDYRHDRNFVQNPCDNYGNIFTVTQRLYNVAQFQTQQANRMPCYSPPPPPVQSTFAAPEPVTASDQQEADKAQSWTQLSIPSYWPHYVTVLMNDKYASVIAAGTFAKSWRTNSNLSNRNSGMGNRNWDTGRLGKCKTLSINRQSFPLMHDHFTISMAISLILFISYTVSVFW